MMQKSNFWTFLTFLKYVIAFWLGIIRNQIHPKGIFSSNPTLFCAFGHKIFVTYIFCFFDR